MRYVVLVGLALLSMAMVYAVTGTHREDATVGTCTGLAPATGLPRMVHIPGGTFTMGSDAYYPEEGPLERVHVKSFWIDSFEVTNGQFAEFVKATGYVTQAERPPDPKEYPSIPPNELKPGAAVFEMPAVLKSYDNPAQWWRFIKGANWRHPFGPNSSIKGKDKYPVVDVTYADAAAYAKWSGASLPTEEQWEYAAHGGLHGKTYAWGNTFRPHGVWQANTWQGIFPLQNSGADGFRGLAPGGCFPANGYGLYDMIGNVWEWTSSWYYPRHDWQGSRSGDRSHGYDPRQPGVPVRVIKGGSYLCSKNYCVRYRPAARQPEDVTLADSHIGFRTIRPGP